MENKPFLIFGYHIETRQHMAKFRATPGEAMEVVEIAEKDGWAVGLQILSEEARREFTAWHRQRVNVILSDARKMDEEESVLIPIPEGEEPLGRLKK